MSEEVKVRNPKPPTKKDMKILAYMIDGNKVNNENGYGLFKCRGMRDAIYRLKCAGYDIKHQDITYTSKNGEKGWFRNWFMKDPEIMQAGAKTEVPVNYRTTGKNAAQFASDLVKSTIQSSLF